MAFLVRKLDITTRAQALRELELTRADEAGVARMADKARFLSIKVSGLKSPAGNIIKQEMLSLGAEAAVARGVVNCSVPTTDVLLMGTRKEMRQLVKKLKPQPFGLKRLADQIAAILDQDDRLPVLAHRTGILTFDKRAAVMGIVNVTPDSFSDGGDFADHGLALERALTMVEEGADVLDIGGESTRPGAPEVSAEEELRRVIPVIREIARRTATPISIDTYKASVARAALDAGASIINDVSGLRLDPEMAKTAAETGAGLILMHMRGTPRDMQSDTLYQDLPGEVFMFLAQAVEVAEGACVAREKIAIDPGIGFGKSVEGNLAILQRLEEFASLGLPVLAGASRKSFIGKTLGLAEPKDRLEGSLAAAAIAVMNGAHIIRAHDVAATRRAVDLALAVRRAGAGEE